MNGHLSDILRFWGKRFADRIALVFPGVEVGWREYDTNVDEIAAGLFHDGVRRGDVVGILMSNRPEFLYTALAVFRVGATLELLNYRFTPYEMLHPISDAGTKYVVTESSYIGILDEAAKTFPEMQIVSVDAVDGVRTIEDIRRPGEAPPARQTDPDEIALLTYTSGTTGVPKGAMLSHRAILANGIPRAMVDGISWRDRVLVCIPLAFTGGTGTYLRESLLTGATAVIQPVIDAKPLVEALETERINICTSVPVVWERALSLPELATTDLSALRSATGAGATMPVHVIQAYQALGVGMRQGWGQTECGGGFATILYDDEAERRLGSVGRPIMFHDVRIVDDTGSELPAGEAGEILVRGPSLMSGYWNQPEATAATLVDGWLHTGDIGCVDEDGYVWMLDRAKDMLVSGGLNVYPAEIEAVIAGLPGLEECAVIGVPDSTWGEVPMLVVPSVERVDIASLGEVIRTRLADYRRPKWLVGAGAPLPRTMSGKVLKREIRKLYAEVPDSALKLKKI